MKYDKIFVLGFPKSGTTTIDKALKMSGLRTAHWVVDNGYCGKLIYDAYNATGDPLAYLSDYDCITQGDVCLPHEKLNYWPNLDFKIIKAIQDKHSNCLFILNRRPAKDILSSLKRWNNYDKRIKKSEIPGLPAGVGSDENIVRWIENHYSVCNEYFSDKTNYLELDIYSDDCRRALSEKLDIEIKWWGVANKNENQG
ncbi:sulfotransferase [Cobetia sp. 5-11-6-3]|uniref:sulfotransferase n=1 Tax=Cobetia sp. 5-11-6-3 TaxID=2737458 RepID=UPI001596B468|nr:sulfotransferase [Cobetia sp. 5-11-6-3]